MNDNIKQIISQIKNLSWNENAVNNLQVYTNQAVKLIADKDIKNKLQAEIKKLTPHLNQTDTDAITQFSVSWKNVLRILDLFV